MPELEDAVSKPLRAVMMDFNIVSNNMLAEICGTTKSAINNWLLGYNLPRVPEMIRLCERTGITLDWLYRGSINLMDPKMAIGLSKTAESI